MYNFCSSCSLFYDDEKLKEHLQVDKLKFYCIALNFKDKKGKF